MKKVLILLLVVLCFLESNAQCSMCRAVPGSNHSAGEHVAGGLNYGIVYLLVIPYLLVMGFVLYYYREPIKKWFKQMSVEE